LDSFCFSNLCLWGNVSHLPTNWNPPLYFLMPMSAMTHPFISTPCLLPRHSRAEPITVLLLSNAVVFLHRQRNGPRGLSSGAPVRCCWRVLFMQYCCVVENNTLSSLPLPAPSSWGGGGYEASYSPFPLFLRTKP
jgi:hypothetical protein